MNAEPRRGGMRLVPPLAAAVLIVLLGAITISGHWPELRQMVRFASKGLVASAPSDITQVEIRAGQESIALRRSTGGWTIEGLTEAVPAELAPHIETGLRLLHVSEPTREIAPAELTPASFADFGLDPPASVVALGTAQGPVATVNFGVLNPAGTSQYVRVGGSSAVYLMARHVGSEWQVAGDMARRLRAQTEPAVALGRSLFLPVSMAQVWAVEIVAGGRLTRFERDSAGNWFRHTGQHSHTGNANAHVADPAQARVIATALELARCHRGRDVRRPRHRCRPACEIRPLIPAGDRLALCARQLGRGGAPRIRRCVRQPRPLRAACAGRRGRDGRRVRGQAAEGPAQGGGSGLVMRS